jgi:hypothetical protein
LKNIVGHSGNDVLELIAGIVLNIVGGTLVGLAVGNLFPVIFGLILIAIGIIFEVRVVAKHRHELEELRNDLEKARAQNEETLVKMEKQQTSINMASEKLVKTIEAVDKQKKEIEETQSRAFARFSLTSRPLEESIRGISDRLQVIEEKLRLSTLRQRGRRRL